MIGPYNLLRIVGRQCTRTIIGSSPAIFIPIVGNLLTGGVAGRGWQICTSVALIVWHLRKEYVRCLQLGSLG